MQNPTIYIDESGNTGSNVLDQQQRCFTLAAVYFTDDELQQLSDDLGVTEILKKANELHFVKLRDSIAGRKLMMDFMSHPLVDENHVMLQFVDKDYAVFAQMVDMLVEPFFYYVLNEDLYRAKSNILFTNALYGFAKNFHTPALIELLKESFVDMVRKDDEYNEDREDEFYGFVDEIGRQANNGMRELMAIMSHTRSVLQDVRPFPTYALDTMMTSFVNLTLMWGERLGAKLNIVTDDSKQLTHYSSTIEMLSKLPEKEVGYDTRKHKFPLPVESFRMVPSDSSLGVQFADLAASLFAFAWNEPPKKWKVFHEKVNEHSFVKLPCYQVCYRPLSDSDIKAGDNDISPLDFLVQNSVR